LWEIWGAEGLDRLDTVPQRFLAENEVELIGQMLDQKINCPTTTSAGRLFDAVAALLDLRQQVAFEGQAAMMLEFIADESERVSYPFDLSEDSPDGVLEVDWEPTIRRVLEDIESGVSSDLVAARFHNMLVDAIEAVATTIGDPKVALSGGCFQNRLLAERTARRLRSRGFDVLTHHQVPCNDGGISLGQIAVAAARLQPANL
jgi:hydrogenase maturation protein HypF